MELPPLSLYVHIPWCVQKCPYCDFNSHAPKQAIPERAYVDALLDDLKQDLPYVQQRKLTSIFIGGGTPSLFSADAIARLLNGIAQMIPFHQEIEITLEANPGTIEANKFSAFIQAGITRLSVGIQSLDGLQLTNLGRIHNPQQAIHAVGLAHQSGANSINVDMMHGLPKQTLQQGLDDLQAAIALGTPHFSWYQLTLEPNTLFYSQPPTLPEDDEIWELYHQGQTVLAEAGLHRYEISAYAKSGSQCQHNLNYWRFGDYLGIGCGAHGKITLANEGKIIRTAKVKHPQGYLETDKHYLDQQWHVGADDCLFEYLLNRARLVEAASFEEFEARTGQTSHQLQEGLKPHRDNGLVTLSSSSWQMTPRGHQFLDYFLHSWLHD